MNSSLNRSEFVLLAIVPLLIILILMCLLVIKNDGFFFSRLHPWKRNEKGLPGDFPEDFERREQAAGKYGAPKGLWLGCLLLFSILFFEDYHPFVTGVSFIGLVGTFLIPLVVKIKKRNK